MEQFFNDLGKKIENALKTEIPKILKKTRGETIYTAALVTDSDCITLYFACNTYEALKKQMQKMPNGATCRKAAPKESGKDAAASPNGLRMNGDIPMEKTVP